MVDPDGRSFKTAGNGAWDQLVDDIPNIAVGAVIGVGLVAAGIASAPVIVIAGIGLAVYGAGNATYNAYQATTAYNSGLINSDTRDYYYGKSFTGLSEAVVGGRGISRGFKGGVKVTESPAIVEDMPQVGLKNNIALVNKNSNDYVGNFGVYEIKTNGVTNKFGVADLDRVTSKSELPTRLHQQLTKFRKNGTDTSGSKVVQEFQNISKSEVKKIENLYIGNFYSTNSTVPIGNQKSFKIKK